MARLLVTGCSGLLGNYIMATTAHHTVVGIQSSPPHNPSYTIQQVDITDTDAIRKIFADFRPEWVLHTAAMTNVDACEIERERAWKINVEGTRNLAIASVEAGARLLYVSTDYVFDGKKIDGCYTEMDEPHPVGYYAATKFAAETVVRELCKDYLIARVAVLYGWHPAGKSNFVTWLLDSLEHGKEVHVVTDQLNNPTYAANAASLLIALFEKNAPSGIYHATGKECISRFEFALQVAEVFGMNKELIIPVTTAELALRAPRPRRCCLSTEKIELATGLNCLSVREGLEQMASSRKR